MPLMQLPLDGWKVISVQAEILPAVKLLQPLARLSLSLDSRFARAKPKEWHMLLTVSLSLKIKFIKSNLIRTLIFPS